ncbi:MAG: AI-2E family transporter [Candidatus Saccharimonas sp.]
MKVRIEIDTRTFVRFWLVVIGFAFGILALYSARTALVILGTALFLALALNGPVSRLARRLPDRSRTLSTAIAFTVVVTILAAVVFLVVPPIVQQTAKFIDSAPTLVKTISEQWKGLGNIVETYHLQPQIDQAVESIQNDSTRWAAGFGKNFISGIGSALSLFAATLLVLVLTFLMLVEGPLWLKRLWSLYTDQDKMENHQRLVSRMHTVVSGYVTGQLTVTGIDALCAGATVFILSLFFPDVPANLALPAIAITFTLALIPMFGATIAGVIVSLLLAFNSLPAGIIFAVYFMIYQQLENNLISPSIQSRRIELSPLAVLAAVTIGLYVFGIAGGIISIPIAGCIKVLVEEYLDRSRHTRKEQSKPLAKLVKKLTGDEV